MHGPTPSHSPDPLVPAAAPFWQAGRFRVDLSRPKVMGIVNLTPDSFSDGGRHSAPGAALRQAEALLAEGADILDLGAESTRPGAQPISQAEEWARLRPVLKDVVRWGVPVSVDTYKPATMRQALELGADVVNDIWALRHPPEPGWPSALDVLMASPEAGVCLMHMHREPLSMQTDPMQGDVLPQVMAFWRDRLQALKAAGLGAERVVLDPGIGFGKTVAQNFSLLARQTELLALGRPLLVGWSRKSSLGAVTGREVTDRLSASVAAALIAAQRGAAILRVHDVAATVDALKVWQATTAQSTPEEKHP